MPSAMQDPRARPMHFWNVGPASTVLLAVFLLAGGVWLTFFGTHLGPDTQGTAVWFYLAGIGLLFFAVYLAYRGRISRRELLADHRFYEPGLLDQGGPDPDLDEFRKL